MIASVTNLSGHLTGAHRTWLDPRGFTEATSARRRSTRRDVPWATFSASAVRFGVPGDVMAAGEGIETILSLRCALPDMAMAAALSANHLAAILFPDDTAPALHRAATPMPPVTWRSRH